MIEGLHGVLRAKREGEVAVDVGGVVLRVAVSESTLQDLPEAGSPVEMLTHLVVREDALDLYGFSSELEREAFAIIAGTKGMGPKLALKILSGTSVRDFQLAILQGDTKRLAAIKGVGKTRAEQLIFALRRKIEGLSLAGEAGERSRGADDAVKAMVALGYAESIAVRAVAEALKETGPAGAVQEVVVAALRKVSA